MKTKPFLKSVHIQNFKAINDSKNVALTPLTVLIGNNGSGKSSLVEGLDTYRSIIVDGLDDAMSRWFGFQHAWNKPVHIKNNPYLEQHSDKYPMVFSWSAHTPKGALQASLSVQTNPAFNGQFIQKEAAKKKADWSLQRDADGIFCLEYPNQPLQRGRVDLDKSALPKDARDFVNSWQFLALAAERMGVPTPKRTAASSSLLLNRDGSNIAQYLLAIRDKDISAFNGIVDAMKFVLDYAEDFQTIETQEVQRTLYMSMKEKKCEIPSWMLSTGTVRVLALLAVLRNPDPPKVVIIEEIENGLDPRTTHMILEEVRIAVQSGRTQVIMTTHSPYVLNLLPLQTVVLVERDNGGNPVFWRPSGEQEVQEWGKRFMPGELYTAGRFRRSR
jgi:predicted ATPase